MESQLFAVGGQAPKLLLKVRGKPHSGTTPLHLIVLIDTSGSMDHEGRLLNVKRSLHYMFPMLSPSDLVSVITFDDVGKVALDSQAMTPDGLHHAQEVLKRIRTGGGTNLGAGLICAMNSVVSTPSTHKAGMLILTDGEINQGIVETADLLGLLRNLRTVNTSLSVFSVGYGIDHNFELLRQIATEGGGSYTVVHNQEHVASVFGDMLGGLMTCMAQNIEILVPKTCRPVTLFRVIEDADMFRVQVGDLYADAEQELLFTADAVGAATAAQASIQVRYFDLTTKSLNVETLSAAPSTPDAEAAATVLELRIQAAKLLAEPRPDAAAVQTTMAAIRALPQQPVWTDFVLRELEYLANPVEGRRQARQVTAAQQSATLALGRGLFTQDQTIIMDPVNFVNRDTDPDADPERSISEVFSSPAQRRVRETLRARTTGTQDH